MRIMERRVKIGIIEEIERVEDKVVIGGREGENIGNIWRGEKIGGGIGRCGKGGEMESYGIIMEIGDIEIGKKGEIIEIIVILKEMIDEEMEIIKIENKKERRKMSERIVEKIKMEEGRDGIWLSSIFGEDKDDVEIFGVKCNRIGLWGLRVDKKELKFR